MPFLIVLKLRDNTDAFGQESFNEPLYFVGDGLIEISERWFYFQLRFKCIWERSVVKFLYSLG